ncbi:MAG: response regulator [Polyangiaceae bacterium]|nr:response regulator [Polyangiaceae bacterium]
MQTTEQTPSTHWQATCFAPAERAPARELIEEYQLCLDHPIVTAILDAVQGHVLILNARRQVVAANQAILDSLRRDGQPTVVGLRPGELLSCAHYTDGPNGCGTGEHCRTCGAVFAILASQQIDRPATGECRLTMRRDNELSAVDFSVRATPLVLGERRLTTFVLHDISALKRRDMLERVFLHDISNTVTAMSAWGETLANGVSDGAAVAVVTFLRRLRDELDAQRALIQAESRQLPVRHVVCSAARLLENLNETFADSGLVSRRQLEISVPSGDTDFVSDARLVLRVLVNMVKNALEATERGGVVRAWFEWRGGRPAFFVHNEAVIAPAHQCHIFERSYSTKGEGRGIGTYAMKLLGENYLRGEVSFSSSRPGGTVFALILPRDGRTATADARAGASGNGDQAFANEEPDIADTILVVDDEDVHLNLASMLLRGLGHKVAAFQSPAEALRVFASAPQRFKMAVADQYMPHMNGMRLTRELHALRPELPVVLCAALGDGVAPADAPRGEVAKVVLKPLTRDQLQDVL